MVIEVKLAALECWVL